MKQYYWTLSLKWVERRREDKPPERSVQFGVIFALNNSNNNNHNNDQ